MTTNGEPIRVRPIIFVGPSIPLHLAQRSLPEADYRPPIKRGDLDDVPAGAVVGIIDGVFAQNLAITRGEILSALGRGVQVFGAASMGALRAAEVPGMNGLGRIYAQYASGAIDRDDEVALLFDPDTQRPMTTPLVNIRYAVERLVRSGTLPSATGRALVERAQHLHYTERTYANVLRHPEFRDNPNVRDIQQLLGGYDLKHEDAQLLLETLAARVRSAPAGPHAAPAKPAEPAEAAPRALDHESAEADVIVWEYGDRLSFRDLVRFLVWTGAYEPLARSCVARFALAGAALGEPVAATPDAEVSADAQALLDGLRQEWGWTSPEEAHVTLRDLGIGLDDLAQSLEAESIASRRVEQHARSRGEAYTKALRAELWMNELALKREALRAGAIRYFATLGRRAGATTEAELSDARRTLCRLRRCTRWVEAAGDLARLGLSEGEVSEVVDELALARRAGRGALGRLRSPAGPHPTPTARARGWRALGLAMESCSKASDSARFSLDTARALEQAQGIAERMGIRRIGMIGELDKLGIHVAQAFGERTGWAVTFSSGKSATPDGARIGSIMEEAEIHAQDAYDTGDRVYAAFNAGEARGDARGDAPMLDPSTLDLPFDSRYRQGLEIGWVEAFDLVRCERVLVPRASLSSRRLDNDIYFSERLGAKVFTSNGLGSGFSLAEATVHAAAEYIERHALRLAELELENPGKLGARQFWFVDIASLPEGPARLVERFHDAGLCVRILDITAEVAVPTYYVKIYDDPFSADSSTTSDGTACHPDPEVAVTMALLEAAQTKIGFVAGAREDYSLNARSLGRHERPRPLLRDAQMFWFSNDRPVRSFSEARGCSFRDIRDELEWIVDRVSEAGLERLIVCDYTIDRIRPAHVVRVIIPGLETINPFFTGARARAASISDLLPVAG